MNNTFKSPSFLPSLQSPGAAPRSVCGSLPAEHTQAPSLHKCEKRATDTFPLKHVLGDESQAAVLTRLPACGTGRAGTPAGTPAGTRRLRAPLSRGLRGEQGSATEPCSHSRAVSRRQIPRSKCWASGHTFGSSTSVPRSRERPPPTVLQQQ